MAVGWLVFLDKIILILMENTVSWGINPNIFGSTTDQKQEF